MPLVPHLAAVSDLSAFLRTSALCMCSLAASGCDKGKPAADNPANAAETEVRAPTASDLATYTKGLPGSGDKLLARIETPLGTLNCELFPDKAPMTVANFVGLATGKKAWRGAIGVETNKRFYEGLIFHRVIPGFMIQGGDPTGTGRGDPGYRFDSEIVPGLEMGPGALAMANAGLTTNGSQFFVMEGSRPDLVGKHTIFGKCAELDVVEKITHTPTKGSRPNDPVTMKVSIRKG
jgi:peptidyl-prolyl cis-trans isomerase A (cyclophilin A)